ncbi:MAG: O-antigen ligase domain-containing protein [Moorea sp. SIO1G6]|uniref:O-antigen ligase domain-containing protein n=1 Tax=Moorena sp. SIO1G6 TaxID=2607840 RepID=UPI0013C07619|nr:O-antigen ligase domain-containing protein [Moorena sp. SIO1G6]NES83954.1 O-antigen ligase domain-containing protein [Moorena sp. SIO2B7]NET67752.1 O-antigen ligase domain-containing protein [Moorena sp. SIO1G6]
MTKGIPIKLEPAPAWTAILLFVVITILGIIAGAGSILRILLPVVGFAVGLFLYRRYPVLYLGFMWWLWFLMPLVRRLIDYRSNWVNPSPVLLVAPVVTWITVDTFLKYLPRAYKQGGLPFILGFTSILYGFIIGLIKSTPIFAIRGLIDWFTPILLGFYLFINWRDYPRYRENIQRTFLWGVLVMGVYGIVQYVIAPEWDRFWLINARMFSMGNPEPFGIRLWSTMNSTGPFAATMMVGLLLLFNNKSPLRIPASIAGYLSFLLTLSRTMWASWFFGLASLTSSLKPKIQMRIIISILVMGICIVPLTTIEPFSEVIGSRLATFSDLGNDHSAEVRQQIYEKSLGKALSMALGNGIGNTFTIEQGEIRSVVIDSGILDMFFTLGWFGTLPYMCGLLLLVYSVFQYPEIRRDSFMSAARAIGLSNLIGLPIGSAMLGVGGCYIWGFLGLTMAAHKYHQHQKKLSSEMESIAEVKTAKDKNYENFLINSTD